MLLKENIMERTNTILDDDSNPYKNKSVILKKYFNTLSLLKVVVLSISKWTTLSIRSVFNNDDCSAFLNAFKSIATIKIHNMNDHNMNVYY